MQRLLTSFFLPKIRENFPEYLNHCRRFAVYYDVTGVTYGNGKKDKKMRNSDQIKDTLLNILAGLIAVVALAIFVHI